MAAEAATPGGPAITPPVPSAGLGGSREPTPRRAAHGVYEAGVLIGAQDCSPTADDSARTGEVSAAMLADVGARYVIVGHSERRTIHAESNDLVRRKAQAALTAGLIPIVCVGETLAEREAGRVAEIAGAQVRESAPAGAAHERTIHALRAKQRFRPGWRMK